MGQRNTFIRSGEMGDEAIWARTLQEHLDHTLLQSGERSTYFSEKKFTALVNTQLLEAHRSSA